MKNWKSIPMPKGIAKLPRTEKGIPVPFVALWSSEKSFIRYDPEIQHHAVFSKGAIGQGTALLGQMDTFRQRQCMLKPLCSVCGKRLKPGEGWITDNGTQIWHQGAARPIILEPWNCGPCLAYSLQVCPGIKRSQANGRFDILKVKRFDLLKTLIQPEGDLADKPVPEGGLISYLKLVPLEYEATPSHLWLAAFEAGQLPK